MKIATRTLALLAVLTLFCSLADARPIRLTFIGAFEAAGLNANGNFITVTDIDPDPAIVKAVKFPRSGVIINRVFQKNTTNLSGKRHVFLNVFTLVTDPETMTSKEVTRSRFVYPKGKVRKSNLVRHRRLLVHNPKKPTIPADL